MDGGSAVRILSQPYMDPPRSYILPGPQPPPPEKSRANYRGDAKTVLYAFLCCVYPEMGNLKLVLPEALPHIRHHIFFFAILFLIGIALQVNYARRAKRQKYNDAPIACIEHCPLLEARKRFRNDACQMLREGYEKYKGRPFYIPSPLGERLMIPGKYVEELKTAPVNEVDFVGTFYEMFEGKYTTMGSRSTLHPRTAKQQLNQQLEDTLTPVKEEIDDAFKAHLPKNKDWTEFAMGDTFVQIVARVSSRMFGGTELSRHKEWVDATINFAVDGFLGAQAIKKYPHFIRPIMARWMPALTKIKDHTNTAKRVIVPILEKREQLDSKSKPADFLQWMADNAKGEERDKEFIASIQLKLSFAAIHTSAAAPTQILYDLCARPEYIQPLREEIERVMAEHSNVINKQSLRKLVKMDSFMKESQRFNPLLLITFERLVTRDFTLKDGFFIPAGTQIGVPTQAISMDSDLYPNPDEFDGFRFAKLRESNHPSAARMVYAASNLESMAFGYGRHACPGRYFADCEIKMIVVYLLQNYDFKFPEGVTERPKSVLAETQCLPNHKAQVLLKGRS